jgi:hypothetical protein
MRKKLCFALILALGLATVAMAQDKSVVGTWKLDVKKSSFGKGPAPKSGRLVITDDKDTSLKWKYTEVGADGKAETMSYAGAFDGKQHPVTGAPTMYKSAAFTRTPSGEIDITWTKADGSTETETSTVEGNTMTNKNGDVTEVLERAPAGAKAGTAKSGKAAPKM